MLYKDISNICNGIPYLIFSIENIRYWFSCKSAKVQHPVFIIVIDKTGAKRLFATGTVCVTFCARIRFAINNSYMEMLIGCSICPPDLDDLDIWYMDLFDDWIRFGLIFVSCMNVPIMDVTAASNLKRYMKKKTDTTLIIWKIVG